ncbi:MFS transporter [Aciduricibacillus chroicocephali]|uniref:MFS transporter n=1 Tax=Aciduricibacillus chroicocephali TaxID=3054939 RepID=A0ABY9KXK1_9BACI|nr:MFS transporter [Bacillaceae bacterium 44XB]
MKGEFIGQRVVAIAFITLMGAFGLNLAAGQFFAPLSNSFGWSLTTISLAVSINMITWGIFQPIMGKMIDRFGPKPVIAGGASIMGISFLLMATITEIWQFYFYYGILTAIGFAACGSMANSVLISRWFIKKRPMMLARSSMGMNIGQLLLLPLTGFLIGTSGFKSAFLTLGLIMLIVVVPLITFMTKNEPAEVGQYPDNNEETVFSAPVSSRLSEALRNKTFWIASLGFATCGFTLYMTTMHLPKLAVDLGGAESLGGQLLGLAAFASAISMWLTGQWTSKFGKKRLLLTLYSIRFLSFIWLATATTVWQLYVFAIVYGLASMPVIPLVTGVIGERFGKNAMGLILGSVWLIHQAAAASGVFIAGYLRSIYGSYTPSIWLGAAVLAFGALITAFMKNDEQQSVHPGKEMLTGS